MDLFPALCSLTHGDPDRKGEVWIDCPFCGKDDHHFSFSERGFHCFACGDSGGLVALAKALDLKDSQPYRPRPEKPRPPPPTYAWQEQAHHVFGRLTALPATERATLWSSYRPFTVESIERYGLGYGALPSCRCKHNRLVYPAGENGRFLAFRGRATDCECDKWLQAAGSKACLWGVKFLKERAAVLVCESPIDAALAMQQTPEICAVAGTAGAGTWRDEWTETLLRFQPEQVIVWYDNDLAGTPNEETMPILMAKWRKKNPKAKHAPRQNGPWLYNRLAHAGLPVNLYQWKKGTSPGYDLGAALMEEMHV